MILFYKVVQLVYLKVFVDPKGTPMFLIIGIQTHPRFA